MGSLSLMNTHTTAYKETHSPKQTQSLGKHLGLLANPGDLILLIGELGSGKTCLTQGIAQGLNIQGYVRSPTFILVNEYQGRIPLYHIDLYRLDGLIAIQELGLEEYIESDGLCVIEWADKAMPTFPREHLLINIESSGSKDRSFQITAYGHRHQKLLELQ